jgi:hypothetical protein
MVYAYAIAEGLGDIADLVGVQGESLATVPVGDGCVVVSDIAATPPLDPNVLRQQDALVRALHDRSRALLPMRFGTVSTSRNEMLHAIDAREGLLARLASVRGCEQMIVRVLGTAVAGAPVETPASGTDYLRARAKAHEAGPELSTLAEGLPDLARDVRIEAAGQPGVLGSVYHLIERGRAREYREAIDRLARDLPHVRVVVSGPSPAYAFA